MRLLDRLLGRPLRTSEDRHQKLGVAAGAAVFGLDALGSTAYGPEAALTLLIPLGANSIHWVVPISTAIIVLLAIVCFSYLQTIPTYPEGGGSYQVASRNLGSSWGVLAAAALMIDYVLTVAVGVSAGTGALVSAVPTLKMHALAISLAMLLVIMVVNLRGLREAGTVLLYPAGLFVLSVLSVLGFGILKTILTGGHPHPLANVPQLGAAHPASAWVLVKAFAAGCTAMTGVEAVSNGVTAFQEPRTRTARRSLLLIVGILAVMLAAVAVLCRAYSVGATHPGGAGYESVLSQLTGAIAGRNVIYYVTMSSIVLVLALQADTAFAGFPRLCSILAQDEYLPRVFSLKGRRLVYTYGIVILTLLAGSLLVLFGAVTDRLIPLFAVGAFLAFTLSQAGMVAHWRREHGTQWSMIVNALGAAATAATLVLIVTVKFAEGAWATLIVIPGLVVLMRRIHAHNRRVSQEVASPEQLPVDHLCPPLAVVPVQSWDRVSQRALRFALSISPKVQVLHVDADNKGGELKKHWEEWVRSPAEREGLSPPELVVLPSPYRVVVKAILEYVAELQRKNPGGHVAVVVPSIVERRWYRRFLHSQRSELLTALLLLNQQPRVSIVNVPWYLHD